MSEPYRTADNAVVPDVYVAAQYGGSCIDDNVVSDVGMSFHVFYKRTVISNVEGLGAEGNVLIKLDPFTYHGGLTDYYAGTVVDEEVVSYGGAGVDVYTCSLVSKFSHLSRKDGHSLNIEFMSYPVDGYGIEGRIREYDLFL